MTRDCSCCNAAWESLASLGSLASLASLAWDHLLHGNHLRSRHLNSDGLQREVRLRGDLGGSNFWRVRCSKIQNVLGLATFVVWTQKKIDWNIGGCNSAKRNSSSVGVTCDNLFYVNQNAPNAFSQNSENQTIKDKKVLGRQIKAESSFAMISWCYLMVKQLLEGGS